MGVLTQCNVDPMRDPLRQQIDQASSLYAVDLLWFVNNVHCRQPLYTTINFVEYFILNEDNDVIDSIQFFPSEKRAPESSIYFVDKKKYDKIMKYVKKEKQENMITKEQVEACTKSLEWLKFNITGNEETTPHTFEHAAKIYLDNAINIIKELAK